MIERGCGHTNQPRFVKHCIGTLIDAPMAEAARRTPAASGLRNPSPLQGTRATRILEISEPSIPPKGQRLSTKSKNWSKAGA